MGSPVCASTALQWSPHAAHARIARRQSRTCWLLPVRLLLLLAVFLLPLLLVLLGVLLTFLRLPFLIPLLLLLLGVRLTFLRLPAAAGA